MGSNKWTMMLMNHDDWIKKGLLIVHMQTFGSADVKFSVVWSLHMDEKITFFELSLTSKLTYLSPF